MLLRLVLALSAATAAAATPQALVTKLLDTPIRASELPAGFTHPQSERQSPSAHGLKYHAVGLVDVALAGPDAEDAFAWVVFPSHADAVADLDNPAVGNGVKVIDVVPGITRSLVLTGVLGKKIVTDAAAAVGNVVVQGVVAAPRLRERTAILLLRAAIAHLQRVG